tara:strand:- start:133 stop:456 length:324 start_codon:yes stop_codon:yes gene_type:complete
MGKTRSTGDLVSSNLITTDISNDRIGIGSGTPSSKLDVLGDVNISGVITTSAFIGDGSGLTGIATNIQAGENITVLESPAGNFIVTSTASGGGGGSNGFAVIAGMIF